MSTTNQVSSKRVPNPEGKGGFKDHPENRNPGGWDKTQSISYQYNRLMRMSTEELHNFQPETVAQDIAMARIRAARDQRFGLGDAKEITDRTEGKAAQSIDVTTAGEKLNNIALVQFVDGNSEDTSPNTD